MQETVVDCDELKPCTLTAQLNQRYWPAETVSLKLQGMTHCVVQLLLTSSAYVSAVMSTAML